MKYKMADLMRDYETRLFSVKFGFFNYPRLEKQLRSLIAVLPFSLEGHKCRKVVLNYIGWYNFDGLPNNSIGKGVL